MCRLWDVTASPPTETSRSPLLRWFIRAQMCLVWVLVTGASAQQVRPGPIDPSLPTSSTCAVQCHIDVWNHKYMHGPAARECEACHVQGSPDEHKFYLVEEPKELCVRCHSLAHQSGIHTPVGEGACLECHSPHGSEFPSAVRLDPRRDLCLKCHADNFRNEPFVHGPVAVGACVLCHKPHASTLPNLLADEPRKLCLTCHAEVVDTKGGLLHEHGAVQETCTACHNPHASVHEYQLREEAPNLCAQCHQDKIDEMTGGRPVVHGAITAQGGCTTCHAPHTSVLPALERTTQPGLCLSCHDKELKTADGRTLTNMAKLLKDNPDHHGPIREGACTACHAPHSSEHFQLLIDEYPPEFYAPFSIDRFKLCFECHISDLVLKPTGKGLTNFRDGDKNLHWLHVNQEKGRTCRACHEVHASQRPAHIREAVPFGSAGWMLEINFEQTTTGGSCAPACHKTHAYDRGQMAMPTNLKERQGEAP